MFCRCTCWFFLVPVSCQQPSIRQECLHCCCLHLFVNEHVTFNTTVAKPWMFGSWDPKQANALSVMLKPPASQLVLNLVVCSASFFSSVTLFSILYSSSAMRSLLVNFWMLYSNSSWKLSFSRSICSPLPVLTALLIVEYAVSSNPWKLWTVWSDELLWHAIHVGSCDLMLGNTSVFNCILNGIVFPELPQHHSTTLLCGLHNPSMFSAGSNSWK